MSALSAWLARACLRLYPREWRDRYGEELLALTEDADIGVADLVDLLVSAARQRFASISPGGKHMTAPDNPWPGRIAAAGAFILAAWTAVFIALNVLRYNLGLALGEETEWWYSVTSPIPAMLGVLGPAVIAFGLAVLGMTSVSRGADASGVVFTARIRPTRMTLLAAAVSAALILIILGYVVSENLIEAMR